MDDEDISVLVASKLLDKTAIHIKAPKDQWGTPKHVIYMESALPLYGSWGEVALAMLNAFAEHWDVSFKVTNCSFDCLTITVVGEGLEKIKKAGKGGVFRIKLEDYKVYKNVLVHEPRN